MIINIDNEAQRLQKQDTHPNYCPFIVIIHRSKTSRNPLFVRRETLQMAMAFVEEVTGLSAIRYVTNGQPGQLYAFTGKHEESYGDPQYLVAGVTIGPMMRAELCAGCGATLPNSWTRDPYSYVHIGDRHYCPTCPPQIGESVDAVKCRHDADE